MKSPERGEITRLLGDLSAGGEGVADKVFPLIYDELRALASRYMKEERSDHTLQATALVNEAYLRLVDQTAHWESRAHFFRMAAKAMRQILVDHARKHRAAKRPSSAQRMPLTTSLLSADDRQTLDLLALDEALKRLASEDSRKSTVVELRFFAGLTAEETAKVLQTSLRTVQRDWQIARAWLYRELSQGRQG